VQTKDESMNNTPIDDDHSAVPMVRREIDAVCSRFEEAWKVGEQPSIAEYLGETSQPFREELLRELLWLDIRYRSQGGQSTPRQFYDMLFPGQSALVM
jgi:hypothetical protein